MLPFSSVKVQTKGLRMGKNPNSFQKRQREFDKKRKAEDKRKRRQAQKIANTDHKSIATVTKVDADDDSTE
jgi:hypothetical protein